MPDVDGFELAAMIRQHPRCQRTAIIFVSAIHMSDIDRVKGYETGAVDYVSVPVIPEILRAKIRVFIELYPKTDELKRLNEVPRHASGREPTTWKHRCGDCGKARAVFAFRAKRLRRLIGARTNFLRCWRTSCEIRSRRFAM